MCVDIFWRLLSHLDRAKLFVCATLRCCFIFIVQKGEWYQSFHLILSKKATIHVTIQ